MLTKLKNAVSRNYPSTHEIWMALADVKYTPDAAILGRRLRHKVFIYSSMQENLKRHGFMEGATKHNAAFTAEHFSLWKKPIGPITEAIAMQNGMDRIQLPIKGELYSVSTPQLISLDRYHENGVWFQRRQVKLVIPCYALIRLKYNEEGSEIKVYDSRYAEIADTTSHPGYITQIRKYTTRAWMYIGTSYWEDMLDGGYTLQLVKKFNPVFRGKSYYRFTNMEYNE